MKKLITFDKKNIAAQITMLECMDTNDLTPSQKTARIELLKTLNELTDTQILLRFSFCRYHVRIIQHKEKQIYIHLQDHAYLDKAFDTVEEALDHLVEYINDQDYLIKGFTIVDLKSKNVCGNTKFNSIHQALKVYKQFKYPEHDICMLYYM